MTTTTNPTALRTAIQRTIEELASNGRFFRVRYDGRTPATIDPSTADDAIKPDSVAVNEVAATFEPDPTWGRDVRQRRTSWLFELRLGFPNEATVAFFEQDVADSAPRVKRTAEHPFALLRITEVEYTHPVRGGAGGGSTVVITFEAQIGR